MSRRVRIREVEMGVETGLDLPAVIDAAGEALRVLGRRLTPEERAH